MLTQRINITLPIDLLEQLNTTVPPRGRSKFITNAVTEKLLKNRVIHKELEKSLQLNHKFYEKEYEDWKALETEGWPE
jgi:metal-responsive CopG/Arc/MetJ family transcriptional regulator